MDRRINELGPDGRWFWGKALEEREICESHDVERVLIACKILDEIRSDERLVEKEGRYVRGRFNRSYQHPALRILAENRAIFIRVIRELGLDVVDDRQEKLF